MNMKNKLAWGGLAVTVIVAIAQIWAPTGTTNSNTAAGNISGSIFQNSGGNQTINMPPLPSTHPRGPIFTNNEMIGGKYGVHVVGCGPVIFDANRISGASEASTKVDCAEKPE